MWVAIPVRLEFRLDKSRHTVSIAEKFANWDGEVHIMSAVDFNYDSTMKLMMAAVMQYVDRIIEANNQKVSRKDFTLVYNIQEVKSGLFWSKPGVVSYVDL